ncbi:MAG: hypothetical protein KAT77_05890 [Nanoarchaeota archaeon]|nr:hypothetical protein [Nanoarchaeota archaeon]
MGLLDWVPFIGKKAAPEPEKVELLGACDDVVDLGEAMYQSLREKKRKELDILQRLRIVTRQLDDLAKEERKDSETVIKYIKDLVEKLSGKYQAATVIYFRKARFKKDEKKILYGMVREHKALEEFEGKREKLKEYVNACAALIAEAEGYVDKMNAEIKKTDFWYKKRNMPFSKKSEWVAMRVEYQKAIKKVMPLYDSIVSLQDETNKVGDFVKKIEALEAQSKSTLRTVVSRLQEEKKAVIERLILKKLGKKSLKKGQMKKEKKKHKFTNKAIGDEVYVENPVYALKLLKDVVKSEEGIIVEEDKIIDHMKKIMALVRLEYLEERKARPKAP